MEEDEIPNRSPEKLLHETQQQHVTLSGAESPEPTPPPTSRNEIDIFISYKVQPDESLARALKTLVESAFDPTPNVFVSGLGGIAASSGAGFREQIQDAAGSSKAFIGVISPESKEREWIIFEAGAAFGKKVPYVPMVFGVPFEDLPSTIGGNQAVRYTDKERVHRTFQQLAPVIQCALQERFGNRYGAFIRTTRSHFDVQVKSTVEAGSDLETAMQLAAKGESDAARALFESCLENSPDDEEACKVLVSQHLFADKPKPTLAEFLDALESKYRETATWAYWMATEEVRPATRHRLLERVIEKDSLPLTFWRIDALKSLLRTKHDAEARDTAERKLVEMLRSPAAVLRSSAATALLENHPNLDLFSRLVFASTSLNESATDLYQYAAEDAGALEWHQAALYLWDRATNNGSGHAYNGLGFTLDRLDLPSLAYEAYDLARSEGVAVSAVNMANLLSRRGVSMAGLALVREITKFDAADHAYPYDTRARLERSVQNERRRRDALVDKGRDAISAIACIVDIALQHPHVGQMVAEGEFTGISEGGEPVNLTVKPDGSLLVEMTEPEKEGRTQVALQSNRIISGLYYSPLSDAKVTLGTPKEDGWLLTTLVKPGEARWLLQLHPRE